MPKLAAKTKKKIIKVVKRIIKEYAGTFRKLAKE